MNYPVSVYVDAAGFVVAASMTDQRYTRAGTDARTLAGYPLAYAGKWYGIQMAYRPFRNAVRVAQRKAARKKAALARRANRHT